jgi:hypothetical protein
MRTPSEAGPKLPFSGIWGPVLTGEWGAAIAAERLGAIRAEYGRLLAEHGAHPHRGLRRHLNGNILPQLAAYRALGRAVGAEASLAMVKRLHLATLEKARRQHARLGALPIVFALYRLAVPAALRFGHPAAGWDVEWVENSRERIHAKVHRCFYHRWLEEHGAGELIAIYCEGDDHVFAELGSPYVAWARERTRLRGDAYCDVKYERPRRERSAP